MRPDENKKRHIVVCGKGGGSDDGAVRFDEAQTLTSAEQLQARENIGAITQEDVLNYKQIPSEWDTAHTMADLIADIAADNNAVEGKSYMGTVSLSDLPASLLQGEIMIDIMSVDEGLGKNVRFTLTSSNTAPYHWEYTSAYGSTGTWRGFVVDGSLATVATSGSYNDLQDKPTIPAAQIQSDWNQSDNTQVDYIKNKPTILTQWFGTKQEYDAILVKDPDTIYHIEGGAPVQSDWNEADSSSLAYIANKPTIPAAQVNSDWNANSGVAQILNKPTIPAAQVNSDWNAVSGVAQILNKPTIPTVPAMTTETLTFTLQGGTTQTITFFTTVTGYFYVEDASGAANTLSIVKHIEDAPTIEVFKSTDQVNWESMGSTDTTPITATVPANGKLYLKATTNCWGFPYRNQGNFITCSGNYNAGGSIMSLIFGDNFIGTVLTNSNNYAIKGLFYDSNTLVDCSDLIMPASTVTEQCCGSMFRGCTALTTAPALPATTLAQSCYFAMFEGCTALTTAPALPATTLAEGCYAYMFTGCTNLNSVTSYANSGSTDYLGGWLTNVAAQGDFYNLGGATYESGDSGIPSGWTEHTTL